MFVKRGENFDAAWAVVDLVANAPEKSGIVPRAMPPVEDERSYKPAEQPFERRFVKCRDVK